VTQEKLIPHGGGDDIELAGRLRAYCSQYLVCGCGNSRIETIDELIEGALVDHKWWSDEEPITVASSILSS
jgi:hypothetical protein